MPTLTHVSMWDDKHGWQRITAYEAKKKFPYGLPSRNSNMFLCELCSQYVTLAVGNYNAPYFKHPPGSNDCEEKFSSQTNIYKITNPRGFSLPLRVRLSGSSFEIFIGFLPIAEKDLLKYQESKERLEIKINERIVGIFNIDNSRFSSEHISYLSIGGTLAEQYSLLYSSNLNLKDYWPLLIDGFNKKGTLFDYVSGKRLSRNASVLVDKDYLLFIDSNDYINFSYYREDISLIKDISLNGYAVYKVRALKISRRADDFFRRYGGILTDNPAILTLLYPFAALSSHLILHTSEKIWLHKTIGYVEAYPLRYISSREKDIFSIKSEFQQILSINRFENKTSVLKYTLLRKVKEIIRQSCSPQIRIYDNNGKEIIAGEHYLLPINREVNIVAEFDGFIEVYKEDFIVNRISIKGNERFIIGVKFNRRYLIYQGLDCVYSIAFVREIKEQFDNDKYILAKLKSYVGDTIPITHSIGSIATKIAHLPLTLLWLREQIKKGKIDKRAKLYLQKLIRR